MPDPEDKKSGTDRLTRQQAIGSELRDVFGRLQEEPIPDSLRDLAAQLDEKLLEVGAPGRASTAPTSVNDNKKKERQN